MKLQILAGGASTAATPRRRREPVTVGVPWPRGMCLQSGDAGVRDQGDRPVPMQARALDHWSDGSIRWMLVDLQVDCDGSDRTFTIDKYPAPPVPPQTIAATSH